MGIGQIDLKELENKDLIESLEDCIELLEGFKLEEMLKEPASSKSHFLARDFIIDYQIIRSELSQRGVSNLKKYDDKMAEVTSRINFDIPVYTPLSLIKKNKYEITGEVQKHDFHLCSGADSVSKVTRTFEAYTHLSARRMAENEGIDVIFIKDIQEE